MGLGEENEPPKKKLKQAQLCFTPKSQKRKLTTDLDDDDVQFVKIIRKDSNVDDENLNVSNKENHLSLNKSLSTELDKKTKSDVDNNVESKISSDVKNVEENACFASPDASVSTKNDPEISNSQADFSLSISDSVLETINNKNLSVAEQEDSEALEESSKVPSTTSETESNKNNDDDSGSDSEKKVTSSIVSDSNEDGDLNKTVSEVDDSIFLSSSNEESPDKKVKSSPSSGTKKKNLTPKRIESQKRREEKERLRLEKLAQRERRKEEKIKLIEEKKKKKEEKRQAEQKQKEEEKKLKDEERKKKDEEKKQKEEEKKKKDEEKRLKDEEKRKREEAKEEEKRKKEEIEEKEKAAFAKFFKKSKQSDLPDKEKTEELEEKKFMPFPMKPDMRLANNPRRLLNSEDKAHLDSFFSDSKENANDSYSYINDIKSGEHVPLKTEGTWPLSSLEEEHDVIIIESTENGDCVDVKNGTNDLKDRKKKMKAKLLQFHDNRRPPYWGTWRKKSKYVKPRRPLGQDKVVFDYEVDSDSEWEDEGEGEDIEKEGDSDGEQSGDEEEVSTAENGYILDNTFVPHGYLSDEEVQPEEEDVEDNDPENQKLRMKLLKQEFEEEMKSKTERLKPRLLGCVWISNGITEISSGSLYEGLMAYRAVWNEEEGSIEVSGPIIEDSPSSTPQTKKVFPPSVLSTLVKYVHGSHLPMSSLVKEFLMVVEKEHPSEHVSKRAVTLKIKEIASKTYDYSTGKPTWSVNLALCQEYGLKPLSETNVAPPPAPALPLAPQVPEKPKDSPLLNFLKGSSTPPVKKKVAFITLPKTSSYDYTPGKLNESGGVKNFGTPRPVDPVLKKRAQLITISSKSEKDDPDEPLARELPKEKSDEDITKKPTAVEVVDLCSDP